MPVLTAIGVGLVELERRARGALDRAGDAVAGELALRASEGVVVNTIRSRGEQT